MIANYLYTAVVRLTAGIEIHYLINKRRRFVETRGGGRPITHSQGQQFVHHIDLTIYTLVPYLGM